MSRPLLCATVFETGFEEARVAMLRAAPFADLLEIRLDALPRPEPEALVAMAPRPVIVTCRAEEDGGLFRGTEKERLALLRRGVDAGAAWVDIELRAADRFDAGPAKRIVSHHDFEGTPRDLEALLARLRDRGAAVAKLVTAARGPEDVLRLLRALRGADFPLAAHPLGRAGRPGRILAARFGSAIVYGSAGAAAAPGQPTLRSLVTDYRLDRDLSSASVILLLGGNLDHSVSPRMMNRAFARASIPALYVPFEAEDPGPVLAALGELEAVGAAVTIPLKETVIPLLHALAGDAERVGAVNTVVRRGDRLVGDNTDLGGALDALHAVLPSLDGLHAVLLGAGGAARALALGLAEAGARLTIVNRTRRRADRLAREVGARTGSLAELDPEEVDLVVNATPVGQWPRCHETPVPAEFLRPKHVVFDAVYNPLETRLLREAGEKGCRVVPGIEMLARQGARQIEIWFGGAVPPGLREEGVRALEARRTVMLVGMRGAGKTTVGRLLSARLGRPFLDLDAEIEREAGRSIPDLFREEGEAGFRERERRELERALLRPGLVLAVGGGALDSPRARELVARFRPRVVLLAAAEEVLAERIRGSDRPSLTGKPPEREIGELLARRRPVWESLADLEIDSGRGPPEEVAEELERALRS